MRAVLPSSSADPTAVIGRRIAAYVVDALMRSIILVIAFFLLAENPSSPAELTASQLDLVDANFDQTIDVEAKWNFDDAFGGVHNDDEVWFVEGGEFSFVNLLFLGYGLLMFVSLEGGTGRTLGKSMFGIATVDEEGRPPGVGRALVRWLLFIIDLLLLFVPALIAVLTSRGHRRIGDMAARTYVVRADALGQPIAIDAAPVSPAPYGPVASPTPPAPGEPQWDPARNAYIQWDAASQQWLQWYDADQQWRPIS
jgi:uncharacterized RDD family membrane protein YckC